MIHIGNSRSLLKKGTGSELRSIISGEYNLLRGDCSPFNRFLDRHRNKKSNLTRGELQQFGTRWPGAISCCFRGPLTRK